MTILGDTPEAVGLCENIVEGISLIDAFGAGNATAAKEALSAVTDGISAATDFLNGNRAPEDTLLGLIELHGLDIDSDIITEYVKTNTMNYGIIMAVGILALVICPCVFICRICRPHKCCKPKTVNYTATWNIIYIFIFMVFALISAISGLMIYSEVDSMYTTGVEFACQTEGLRNDFTQFFDELTPPITSLKSKTLTIIDGVGETMSTTDNVLDAYNGVTNELTDFAEYLDNGVPSPDNFEFSLASQHDVVISVIAEMDELAGPEIRSFQNTKDEINTQVTEVRGVLIEAATDAFMRVNNAKAQISDTMDGPISSIKGVFASAGPIIRSYPKIPMFFCFISVMVGAAAILAWLSPCKADDKIIKPVITFSWSLTYVVMILCFIFGAIFFVVSLVLTDGCEIINDIPKDFGKWVELGLGSEGYNSDMKQAVKVIDGCFSVDSDGNNAPVPVIESLNLTGKFDFENMFEKYGSSMVPVSNMFDFNELADFGNTIDSLSGDDFGLDKAKEELNEALKSINDGLQVELDNFNDAMPHAKIYSCTECGQDTLDECAPESEEPSINQEVKDARQDARVAINLGCKEVDTLVLNLTTTYDEAVTTVDVTLDAIKLRFSNIIAAVDSLKDSTIVFDTKLNATKALLDPLLVEILDLKNFGSCGFTKVHFDLMSDKLCTKTLGSLTSTAVYLVLIAFSSIFIVIFANVLNVRLFGVGGSAVHTSETSEPNF